MFELPNFYHIHIVSFFSRFANPFMEIIIIRYTHHVSIISFRLYSLCTATEVFFMLANLKEAHQEKVQHFWTKKCNLVSIYPNSMHFKLRVCINFISLLRIIFISILIASRSIWKEQQETYKWIGKYTDKQLSSTVDVFCWRQVA